MPESTTFLFFDSRVRRVKRRRQVVKVTLALLLTGVAVALILRLAA